MTLRARLAAAFLAVVLGPVLVGALLGAVTVRSLAYERAADRLDVAATAVGTTLAAYCQRAQAAATVVAQDAGETSREEAARDAVERGLADAVRVEDAAGTVLASAGDLPAPRDAMWTECTGGRSGQAPPAGIVASVALVSPDGTRIGTARAAFAIDEDLAETLANTGGAGVTVLDGRRPVVSSLVDDRSSAVAAAAAPSAADEPAEVDGALLLRVREPGRGQPLRVAITTEAPRLQTLYTLLALAVLVVGALAVLVAFRLASTLTRPLAEVARAAERVADGDLGTRVPVRGRDEVGRLASTFNRMTRELQSYLQAVTASRDQLRGNLALLGDTLSSTHDLDRILEVILETVMAATGAQAGVVLLVERREAVWPGVLVGQCAEGLRGRGVDLPDLRLRIGEGLLGEVAAAGEPRRGRAGEDGPRFAPTEPRCRTYIAVPFSGSGQPDAEEAGLPSSGRLLGVLALYDRLGADDFDDGDLVTLRTFAGQAAVAVENVLLHQEAQRLSLTDPLTGLWNFRYLQVSLHRELERAMRFGRPLAVLAVDLDHFKDVNDRYGPAAGDAVLAEVAARLRGVVREVDLVFRKGGEEFVLLLPETDVGGARRAADRICAELRREPVRLLPGELGAPPLVARLTASIGVAVHPVHGGGQTGLLERADDAMYAAKAAGRDTWRVASLADAPVTPASPPAAVDAPEGGLADGRPEAAARAPRR